MSVSQREGWLLLSQAFTRPVAHWLQWRRAGATSGADATRTMAAVAGRGAYVPDEQVQGTPDPGAMAVAFVLQAVAAAAAK